MIIKTNIIHIIAALDSVITIANIHKIINPKFKFQSGFLNIVLSFSHQVFRHSEINGKNATKKYP
jgi:hypothetical protein